MCVMFTICYLKINSSRGYDLTDGFFFQYFLLYLVLCVDINLMVYADVVADFIEICIWPIVYEFQRILSKKYLRSKVI